MPNYCYNTLSVQGSDENLARFYTENRSSSAELTFAYVLPLSNENDLDEAIKVWGTKWDVAEFYSLTVEPEELTYSFDTAWAPPEPWVIAASRAYPRLTFRLEYSETGVDFEGVLFVKAGVVVFEVCHDEVFSNEWQEWQLEEAEDECIELGEHPNAHLDACPQCEFEWDTSELMWEVAQREGVSREAFEGISDNLKRAMFYDLIFCDSASSSSNLSRSGMPR